MRIVETRARTQTSRPDRPAGSLTGDRAQWPVYLALSAGALVVVFPFVWMLITSLKTLEEASGYPTGTAFWRVFIPSWQFGNYIEAWNAAPFGRYFLNTVLVALAVTACVLVTSTLAGYAFAAIPFPGKNAIFILILATMMIPHEAGYIPNFVIVKTLGWYNQYPALIIPWTASAFNIFLLRQFFASVPADLWESAQLDGASRLRYLFQIGVPLARPALITAGLFSFVGSWNSLLWPLIVIQDPQMQVVQVGLTNFVSADRPTDWHLLMAASAFTALPIIAIYMVAQRYFVEGIARSGIRG
ncbi:MAG TPA: carbohydrate ABC transporter permease [Chloroflexia bacterium]|nr:carbohydrate ABC transporter permease [Chloroflexia bacterium]